MLTVLTQIPPFLNDEWSCAAISGRRILSRPMGYPHQLDGRFFGIVRLMDTAQDITGPVNVCSPAEFTRIRFFCH